jgi:NAD/NADP transhydrogenase alpha subunit
LTPREFARKVFAGQWPILVVGLFFVAAFGLVVAGYWRRGALVMAIGVGVAAVMRLALSEDRAGLLVVRSRMIDFATTASVSAAMLYIAWTIDPLGTS